MSEFGLKIFLSSRDLEMQTGTPGEIRAQMEADTADPEDLPLDFAFLLCSILQNARGAAASATNSSRFCDHP